MSDHQKDIFYKIFKSVLAFLIAIGLCAQPSLAETLFSSRIKLVEERGADLSPGGTILEVKSGLTPLIAVGFVNSYSTHSQRNDLFLTVTSYSDPRDISLEMIGKPFSESNSYLSRLGSYVIAHPFTESGVNSYHFFDTKSNKWTVAERPEFQRKTGLQNFYPEKCGESFLFNHGTAFTWRCFMRAGNKAVDRQSLNLKNVSANAGVVPYFATPKTTIYGSYSEKGEAHLLFCGQFSDHTDCLEHTLENKNEFPYAIWQTRTSLFVSTNWGNLLRLDKATNQIFHERHSDGKSFQLYTAIHFHGNVLLGEFPTGSIFSHRKNLELASRQLPIDEYRNKIGSEVQVLMSYAGRLFAGVWPFGEVHVFDTQRNEWALFKRLFDAPEISHLEPYLSEIGNNLLGQRINDMIVVGDSMYISTGSKIGGTLKSEAFPGVSETALSQYGRIWRLRSPGTIAVDVSDAVNNGDEITIEVKDRVLKIKTGSKVIGQTPFKLPQSLSCGEAITLERGFFGDLMGVKAKTHVIENKLTCK